ncbi:MAG: SH3 domain-containing protein [Anaerolineae bacterium]|nr:SH3 domain-containing protein [Anaerolineae bacterium]
MKSIRRWFGLLAVVWAGLTVGIGLTAQPPVSETCGEMVRLALQTAGDACQATGRNQVCYGHVSGALIPRSEAQSVAWEQVGDTASLTAIEGFTLSPLDETTDQWGVAVMQVQASLPDTLPGQNVTMVLFGDVTIEDAVDDQARIDGQTLAAANVRLSPSTTGVVVGSIPADSPVIITGQTLNRAGETWLRIKYEDYRTRTGWVLADLVQVDLAALPSVEADSLVYNPMQAFYLRTGLGAPQCGEVPTDGVMVQTPEGAGLINLNVNGASISLGSTAFLTNQTTSDGTGALAVTLLEGQGIVESQGVTRVLVPGSQTTITLDETNQASSIPSRPAAYDPAEFSAYQAHLTERGVELPPPAADSQIEAQNPTSQPNQPPRQPPTCEDTDGDGACDTCNDRNRNGICDGLECIDRDGDGICNSCQDRNRNGVCDFDECLDADGDGRCDERCFDLNENGICDGQEPGQECQDRNNNGVCDRDECLDADGDGRCDEACMDRNNNGICDRDECLDADGDGVCDEACIDSDGNGRCDRDECRANPTLPICPDLDGGGDEGTCDELVDGGSCDDEPEPTICLPNDPRPVCTGCADQNGDGICDINQCIDRDGDGRCDCADLNQNGVCDGQEKP